MSALSDRKTRLVFETDNFIHECGQPRRVVVEAHPLYASVRLKGLRGSYAINYAAIYHAAVRLAVEQKHGELKRLAR